MEELSEGGNQYVNFLDQTYGTTLNNIIDVVTNYTTGTGGTKCN